MGCPDFQELDNMPGGRGGGQSSKTWDITLKIVLGYGVILTHKCKKFNA